MFTGIIEETGSVKSLTGSELTISCNKIIEDAGKGDSISVNGVCLTITGIKNNSLVFHVSKTTINHSRFKPGDLRNGEKVNLERALLPTTRLGGHIVTGHIDGKAKIISINKTGKDTFFEFLYPKELKPYVVTKGSAAIDGISLTISSILSASFTCTVIPETLTSTNLQYKKIGDFVHIEADMFARYIYHILNTGEIDEKYTKIIRNF